MIELSIHLEMTRYSNVVFCQFSKTAKMVELNFHNASTRIKHLGIMPKRKGTNDELRVLDVGLARQIWWACCKLASL